MSGSGVLVTDLSEWVLQKLGRCNLDKPEWVILQASKMLLRAGYPFDGADSQEMPVAVSCQCDSHIWGRCEAGAEVTLVASHAQALCSNRGAGGRATAADQEALLVRELFEGRWRYDKG